MSQVVPLTRSYYETYRIHTPVFEGPLDLLLHLIRKEELNIYDIPVSKICESYMNQLQVMLQPDVDIAGDFFVMAATLTQIKSQMLLPREEGDDSEDPRLPLVAQLLEYERFKKAAADIDSKPWLGREIFVRTTMPTDDLLPQESKLDSPVESVDSFQLLVCLKIAMNRTTRPHIEIEVDSTSIRDKVIELTKLLEQENSIQFSKLFSTQPKVGEVIISFLAVLELARLKFIEIVQLENYGPIQVRAVGNFSDMNYTLLDQY